MSFKRKLDAPSGVRLNTIPRTTLLCGKLPPMIFTTRTLSTLKFFGLGGITASAASATNDASVSSEPYCFEAMVGRMASASESDLSGVVKLDIDNTG